MANYVYITPEQARITHEKTIEYSGGGTLEELDFGRLESVLYNIQNDDWYPTFVDKLTHLFFCTCQFHCFADGNKRLAITLSTLFLLLNGNMAIAATFLQKTENNEEQTYFWDGNVTGMEEEGREHFYFQDDLGSPMRLAHVAGRSE